MLPSFNMGLVDFIKRFRKSKSMGYFFFFEQLKGLERMVRNKRALVRGFGWSVSLLWEWRYNDGTVVNEEYFQVLIGNDARKTRR